MCELWCPLATDWGNVADWAAVVAAIAAAGAVVLLTRRTNKLAEAANRIAGDVASLETRRDNEAARLAQFESRLILVSLHTAAGRLRSHYATVIRLSEEPNFAERFDQDPTAIPAVKRVITDARFSIPEATRSRLHNLDPKIAAHLVRAEAMPALLITWLSSVEGRGPVDKTQLERFVEGVKAQVRELDAVVAAAVIATREIGLELGRSTADNIGTSAATGTNPTPDGPGATNSEPTSP